jgi:hypothetical protein
MKGTKTIHQDSLAPAIFGKEYHRLDKYQQAFVDYHTVEYARYKKKVGKMLREAMGKRTLKSEYSQIFVLYITRLPLFYVGEAIKEGVRMAREKNQPKFGIGWFGRRFREQQLIWKRRRANHLSRYPFESDPPWFFKVWKRFQNEGIEGMKWNAWYGAVEKSNLHRRKKDRTKDDRLFSYHQQIRNNVSLIKRVEEFRAKQRGRLPGRLQNRLKYYRHRNKVLKRRIKELEDDSE